MDRELSDIKKEIIEELEKQGKLQHHDEQTIEKETNRERNSALINLAKKHRIIGKDK